jgi:phosphatidate cytidylyltransferase
MLKTRVITALSIVPVFLLALFWFPAWAWGLFTFAIVLAGCWEWSRFCGFGGVSLRVYQVVTAVLALGFLLLYLQSLNPGWMVLTSRWLFVAAGAFWLVAVPLWLFSTWRPKWPIVVGLAGWFVMFPTWAAFLRLRDASPWLLLSLMIIVIVADIGAYFAGRRFGKVKLAPAISPGKTWEGVVGGLIAVMAYFFAWFLALRYLEGAGWSRDLIDFGMWLPGVFLLLGAVSVLGDLFESWMKRCAGMKDSSNLLPGHGGVLDRIDALTAALPVAGLILYVLPKP